MRDQDQGRPLRRVEEFANGVLFAPDGRPVRAVALVDAPPADGRAVSAISFSLDEGQPVEAVSFYSASLLFTPDGRPIQPVSLYQAAGASSANLVVDGDGASAVGWSVTFGSVAAVGGRLRVTHAGAGSTVYQVVTTVAGATYRYSADVYPVQSATFRVGSGGSGSSNLAARAFMVATQSIYGSFVAPSTATTITLICESTGFVEFDNINLRRTA